MGFAEYAKSNTSATAIISAPSAGGGFAAFAVKPESQSDFLGIKNPDTYISDALKQVSETVQHPIKAVESAVGAGVEAVTGAFSNFAEATQKALAPETQGPAQRTANILHGIGSAAQVVFSPISAAFSAAEKLPVLKEAADILQIPFAVTGKIGSFAADTFVDVLPIDQKSKDILKPAFEEIGALAGQIILGGKVMKFIGGGKKVDKKTIDTFKRDAKQEAIVAKDNFAPLVEQPKIEVKPVVSPDLQPFTQEARKYKSAEEFVKAQKPVFRGVFPNVEKFETSIAGKFREYGFSVSESKDIAQKYAFQLDINNPMKLAKEGNVLEGFLMPNAKIKDIGEIGVNEAKSVLKTAKIQNFDGIRFIAKETGESEIIILNPDVVQTKSQLIDFYKEATKGEVPPTAISGVAKQIEAKAIEKGLVDKGYAELAGYDASTLKAQSELGAKYNLDEHIKFTRGEKPLPEGMKPGTPFSIVEDYAIKNGDGVLMQELAKSPLASQISEAASEVSLSRIRETDSPVKAIKEITEIRQKKAETKVKDIAKEKVKIVKEAKIKTWSEFVKNLQCP